MNHRRYTYFTGEDILLLKRRYTSFLKETHRSFIRSGMGALLLMLLILTACVGEELQKPLLGEGEGYLRLQVGAISAEVTSDPLTKATLENLPDTTEFSITIKDANNTEVKHYEKLSQIDNPLVLNAGVKYIVEASYGTNKALQDTPYFYGSDSIYIQANTNNQVTVNASLANAMIIPVVTESLKNHYENNWKLTASVGETSLLLASAEAGIDTLYAHADSIVSLTFTGKNKAGQYVSFKWTDTIAMKACKAYMMQCNPDLSAFSNIQVTAKAKHTYDNGYLTGTAVELNSNLMEANKEAIKEWNVAIKYKGQIIRNYSGSAPNNLEMTKTNEWPYIPQGSSLTASVKLKAGDEISLSNASIEVPKPTFEVTVTGTTSYDLYKAEKISEANGMDAGTIKDIGAKAKIANALLSNPNYSHTFTLTYGDDKYFSKTDTITVGDKTGQSWGNHPITATMVFDGQSIEAKKDCHITGLPYTLKHPANQGDHPWYRIQSKNVAFNSDHIVLEGVPFGNSSDEPIVGSCSFHIPTSQALNFKLNGQYTSSTTIFMGYEFSIRLLNPTTNSIKDEAIFSDTQKSGTHTITSEKGTFDSENCAIVCHYIYSQASLLAKLYNLKIEYR